MVAGVQRLTRGITSLHDDAPCCTLPVPVPTIRHCGLLAMAGLAHWSEVAEHVSVGWFRCALRPCDVVIHVSGWLSAPWGDAAPTVSLEGYGSEGLPVLRVV